MPRSLPFSLGFVPAAAVFGNSYLSNYKYVVNQRRHGMRLNVGRSANREKHFSKVPLCNALRLEDEMRSRFERQTEIDSN